MWVEPKLTDLQCIAGWRSLQNTIHLFLGIIRIMACKWMAFNQCTNIISNQAHKKLCGNYLWAASVPDELASIHRSETLGARLLGCLWLFPLDPLSLVPRLFLHKKGKLCQFKLPFLGSQSEQGSLADTSPPVRAGITCRHHSLCILVMWYNQSHG